MEKFFKNPLYMGLIAAATLLIVVAFVWDQSKNPKKDFFGVLSTSTTPVV